MTASQPLTTSHLASRQGNFFLSANEINIAICLSDSLVEVTSHLIPLYIQCTVAVQRVKILK